MIQFLDLSQPNNAGYHTEIAETGYIQSVQSSKSSLIRICFYWVFFFHIGTMGCFQFFQSSLTILSATGLNSPPSYGSIYCHSSVLVIVNSHYTELLLEKVCCP